MTQRVKSPSWAIILLVICLILRFCDSWLFEDKTTQKNAAQRRVYWHTGHGKRVTGSGRVKVARRFPAVDSTARQSYFFR